jgi:hypothetical protein
MARVRYFLPGAFLFDRDPFLLVAVAGEVERFVGAAALSLRLLATAGGAWLYLRGEEVREQAEIARELVRQSLQEAWRQGAARVFLSPTLEEDSEEARHFLAAGFVCESVTERYEIEARPLGERLERIYQRLRSAGMLPPNVELQVLQPAIIATVRQFLWEHMPHSASLLALETAGHRPENSLALFVAGEIKGVLLSRRDGPVSQVGLRVVAPELRSGSGWANLLLLHESIRSGLLSGLEVSRFEFDPQLHPDTREFAKTSGARHLGRRILLRMDRPNKIAIDESDEKFTIGAHDSATS